ncbi:MAG: hypothetical protein FWD34_05020 [Oscillospiraceae bacterium]|nr:hypothetical protein [Oscillospiraceae bacterium]
MPRDLLNKANKLMNTTNTTVNNVSRTKRNVDNAKKNLSGNNKKGAGNTASANSANDDAWKCVCKKVNTTKFCQSCGKAKPVCAECGADVIGVKFCGECGKPV